MSNNVDNCHWNTVIVLSSPEWERKGRDKDWQLTSDFLFAQRCFFFLLYTITPTSITAASTTTTALPQERAIHSQLRAYVKDLTTLFTRVSDRCTAAEQTRCLIGGLRVKGYHFRRRCTKVLFVILWMRFITMQYSSGELRLMERHCGSSASAPECLVAIWIPVIFCACVPIADIHCRLELRKFL